MRRAIVVKQRVHSVSVSLWTSDVSAAAAVAEIILATARVATSPPWPELPDGWRVTEQNGVAVEFHPGKKSKHSEVLREVLRARTVARKVLGDDPYLATVARVRSFRDNAAFRSHMTQIGERPDLASHFHPATRCLYVNTSIEATFYDQPAFWDDLRSQASRQAIFEHFGGSTPTFIDTGLRQYVWIGVESGGNPSKPYGTVVADTRKLVVAPRTLAWWLTARRSDLPDKTNVDYNEAWSWHRLLRDARGGEPFREAYHSYLRTLRESGSPRAAAKPLADLDQDALVVALRAMIKHGK